MLLAPPADVYYKTATQTVKGRDRKHGSSWFKQRKKWRKERVDFALWLSCSRSRNSPSGRMKAQWAQSNKITFFWQSNIRLEVQFSQVRDVRATFSIKPFR